MKSTHTHWSLFFNLLVKYLNTHSFSQILHSVVTFRISFHYFSFTIFLLLASTYFTLQGYSPKYWCSSVSEGFSQTELGGESLKNYQSSKLPTSLSPNAIWYLSGTSPSEPRRALFSKQYFSFQRSSQVPVKHQRGWVSNKTLVTICWYGRRKRSVPYHWASDDNSARLQPTHYNHYFKQRKGPIAHILSLPLYPVTADKGDWCQHEIWHNPEWKNSARITKEATWINTETGS